MSLEKTPEAEADSFTAEKAEALQKEVRDFILEVIKNTSREHPSTDPLAIRQAINKAVSDVFVVTM